MSIIIMNFYFILMEETMNFFSGGNKLYNSQDYLSCPSASKNPQTLSN